MNALRIPAGLTEASTEFFTMTVCGVRAPMTIHNGRLIEFQETPKPILDLLRQEMKSKPVIESAIEAMVGDDDLTKLARFAMCRYGALDEKPDIDPHHRFSEPEYVPCNHRSNCTYEGRVCSSISVKEGVYLSRTETEVFKRVQLKDEVIAGELFISPYTVTTHWQNIRRKTGLNSKTEIAIWATKKGII